MLHAVSSDKHELNTCLPYGSGTTQDTQRRQLNGTQSSPVDTDMQGALCVAPVHCRDCKVTQILPADRAFTSPAVCTRAHGKGGTSGHCSHVRCSKQVAEAFGHEHATDMHMYALCFQKGQQQVRTSKTWHLKFRSPQTVL